MIKFIYKTIIFFEKKWSEVSPNKYVLSSIILFVWIVFFDKNRLITQYRLSRTIDKYEKEKETLSENILKVNIERKYIQENLEKFGREEYYMSKPDEDIYIIRD